MGLFQKCLTVLVTWSNRNSVLHSFLLGRVAELGGVRKLFRSGYNPSTCPWRKSEEEEKRRRASSLFFFSPCTRNDSCLRSTKGNLSFLWMALAKRTCTKRVSFNLACKNHFAHILYEPHRLHKAKALWLGRRGRLLLWIPTRPRGGGSRRSPRALEARPSPAKTPAVALAGQSELARSLASQSELRRSPVGQSELSAPIVPANGRAGMAARLRGRGPCRALVSQFGIFLKACCSFYFD